MPQKTQKIEPTALLALRLPLCLLTVPSIFRGAATLRAIAWFERFNTERNSAGVHNVAPGVSQRCDVSF